MKRFWATFAVAIAIGTLAVSPVYAQRGERSEAVYAEALNALYARYPEQFDVVALTNAAIRGMEDKIGLPGTLMPVRSGGNYFDHFYAQRDIAMRVSRLSRLELEFAAVEAMLKALDDSHTSFLYPDRAREITARMWGMPGYSGIGIYTFTRDGRTYIWEVFPGSPAEKTGLKRFDRILKVNDTVIDGLDQEDAVRTTTDLIRGPEGTRLSITVQRPGRSEPFTIDVTRAAITVPAIEGGMLAGGVGYIRIRHFEDGVGRTFEGLVFALVKLKGAKALVVDLRHNPGGLVEEMKRVVAALLADRVPILHATYRNRNETFYATGQPALDPSVPVVVLVDETSASASEITAAALLEYNRAAIVGMKTAGAVEMSVYVDLPGGSMMSVTIARLRTGRGMRLEKVGVIPSVPVELTLSDFDAARDSQLERAMREALSRVNP